MKTLLKLAVLFMFAIPAFGQGTKFGDYPRVTTVHDADTLTFTVTGSPNLTRTITAPNFKAYMTAGLSTFNPTTPGTIGGVTPGTVNASSLVTHVITSDTGGMTINGLHIPGTNTGVINLSSGTINMSGGSTFNISATTAINFPIGGTIGTAAFTDTSAYQPVNSILTALSGLTLGNSKVFITDSSGNVGLVDQSSFGGGGGSLTPGTTPVGGSTAGVLFADGSSHLNVNSLFYWNNTTANLGVGTYSPAASLHVAPVPDATVTAASALSITFTGSGSLIPSADGANYYVTVYAYRTDVTPQIYESAGTYTSQNDPNDGNPYDIQLGWTASPNATGYILYINSTDGMNQWTDVGNVTTVTVSAYTGFSGWTTGTPTLTPTNHSYVTTELDGPYHTINGVPYNFPSYVGSGGFMSVDGGNNIFFTPNDLAAFGGQVSNSQIQTPYISFGGNAVYLGSNVPSLIGMTQIQTGLVLINGTGGNGYLMFNNETVAPSGILNTVQLYANSSNQLVIMDGAGRGAAFSMAGIPSNTTRQFTWPNISGGTVVVTTNLLASYNALASTTNDNSATGAQGEYFSQSVSSSGTLTSNVNGTVTTTTPGLFTLTTGNDGAIAAVSPVAGGDYDVEATASISTSGATITAMKAGISTNGSVPSDGSETYDATQFTTVTMKHSLPVCRKRVSIPNGGGNIYVSINVTFSAGTVSKFGTLTIRRVR